MHTIHDVTRTRKLRLQAAIGSIGLAAILLPAGASRAGSFTWLNPATGGVSGNWSDGTNWNSGAGPAPTGADATDVLTFSSAVSGNTNPVDYTSTNDIDVSPAGGTDDFVLNSLSLSANLKGKAGTLTATIDVAPPGGAMLFSGASPSVVLGASNSSTEFIVYNIQDELKFGAALTMNGSGTGTYNFNGGVDAQGFTFTRTGSSLVTFGGSNNNFAAVVIGSQSRVVLAGATSNTMGGLSIDSSSVALPAILTAAAGASVSVGGGSGDNLSIMLSVNSSSGAHSAMVDVSAASSFTVNVGMITVASTMNTGTTVSTGTLKLSNTQNTITASTGILVGTESKTTGPIGLIQGGTGATTINTPTMTIGGQKAVGQFTLDSTGSLTLQGAGGAGTRASLGIGSHSDNNGGLANGSMTLDGTFNATLSSLAVGQKLGGSGTAGGSQGTLTISSSTANHLDISGTTTPTSGRANAVFVIGKLDSANSFNGSTASGVGSVTIGYLDAASSVTNAGTIDPAILIGSFTPINPSTTPIGAISGTLTFSGGTLAVSSGGSAPSILIANITAAANGVNDAVSGTLNLLGGTLTVNNDIAAGLATGSAVATSTLNIDGGTLDLSGKQIGSASNPITHLTVASGTIRNVAQIDGGSGTLTKTTAGTLIVAGSNAYTNATDVSAGTLRVNGTTAGQGGYTVDAGATLGGTGTIGLADGQSIVLAGADAGHLAAISVGAGHLTVNTGGAGVTAFGDNSVLNVTLAGDSIGLLSAQALDLSSTLDAVNFSTTGTQDAGRYVFATYAGPLNGQVFDSTNLVGPDRSIDYSVDGQIALVVAPEPSAAMLSGLGLVFFLRRRRPRSLTTVRG